MINHKGKDVKKSDFNDFDLKAIEEDNEDETRPIVKKRSKKP
jgi:hypothetical protein